MSQSFKLVSAFAGLLIAGTAHSPLAAQIGDVPSTSNQPRPQGFTEIFSSNPLESEWAIHGDNSLFAWDETRQALRVTWDSSRTNSYFHHPLGTTLSASDDFALSFDLVSKGSRHPRRLEPFETFCISNRNRLHECRGSAPRLLFQRRGIGVHHWSEERRRMELLSGHGIWHHGVAGSVFEQQLGPVQFRIPF